MRNSSASNHAQKHPDVSSLPLNNPPPLVVVDCDINRISGCFDYLKDPTTHHQISAAHKKAMADWAVGQGMFSKDAHRLAGREPIKFDEAIHEILNMDAGRLAGLNNLGGWIVWFIRTKATGRRRVVAPKPYNELGESGRYRR
jgi:hypothetical protein